MERLDRQRFEQVIQNGLTLIDCSAVWCLPCQQLQPILEQLELKFENISFYQIDVDQEKELARDLDIISVPLILLYKEGKRLKEIYGLNTLETLENLLRHYQTI